MDLKEIPKELLERRSIVECTFIMDMYKDMSLLDEYSHVKNGEDILTEDGMFYYGLILGMKRAKYEKIDDISICEYIEDKKEIKKGFERRGSYAALHDMLNRMVEDNVDGHYEALAKSNLMIRLHEKGFPVMKDLDKFLKMNAIEIFDYMEYQLADVSIKQIERSPVVDLSTGYRDHINEWNKGGGIGFKIGIPILNWQLLGIHTGHLMFHVGGIGQGKTTTAIAWYVLPAIETGNNVTILANEQSETEWRQMVLSTVLFNRLKNRAKGLDRHKINQGGYTDEQVDRMIEAEQWLENQPGKIKFIELKDYNIAMVKRYIARQSKVGCSLFIYDTLKPENDSSERAWGEFSEMAKKHNVAIVATMQLSPEGMQRKYLDLTCIGKSKATAETASVVVMFRNVRSDEKEKIEAYNWDDETKKIKVKKKLDPEKEYVMIFVPKNRYGTTSPQIIVERNLSFNSYRQVGWYECPFDLYKK